MEEIINSVMQSPENTNPNVLRSQLQNIDGGSGDGNPNTQQTIIGTAANPWGDVNYSDLAAALYSGNAHAVMHVRMGDSVGNFSLNSYDGSSTYTGVQALALALPLLMRQNFGGV